MGEVIVLRTPEPVPHYNPAMVSAVVLAAGASTRMGSPKLLLPLGGEPLVRRTVRQVTDAGFDDVLVVVGYEHEQIVAALEGLSCRHVVNALYESGMGSSFRAAIGAVANSRAAMFALADQPFVTLLEYRKLLETYREHPGGIVSVRYGDVTAPPHLFDREFFPELSKLEQGARPVLQRHANRTVVLQFPPDLLLDVDTPADYERAIERLSAGR
jgi:molybdenum cofactor cytidylyltransferase